MSSPDLLPELQGRLPIQVELALTESDFKRILTETEASLPDNIALLATEGWRSNSRRWASRVARLRRANQCLGGKYEGPTPTDRDGAHPRRDQLHAPDRSGKTVVIDAAHVDRSIGELAGNADLSRFIL